MQDSPSVATPPASRNGVIDGITRFLLVAMLFVCPVFFLPFTEDPFRPSKELLVNWVGLALLLLQAAEWLLTGRQLSPDPRGKTYLGRFLGNPLPGLVALLLLWLAYSTLTSPLPWVSLRTFLNNLALAGFFWATCRVMDFRLAKAAGLALILSSLVNGVWALLQFSGHDPYFTTAAGQAIVGHRVHISGFTGNPNYLAPLFVFSTLLSASMYVASGSLWRRIGWTLVFVALLMLLSITQTLSGLASLLVAFLAGILGYFKQRGFRIWIVAAAGALTAGLVAIWILTMGHFGGGLDNRGYIQKQALQTAKLDFLLNGRYYAGLVTWEMIADHPFRGYGMGLFPTFDSDYESSYPQLDYYEFIKQEGLFQETHNDYLQFSAENGLIGLVLLLIPVIWIAIKLRPVLFEKVGMDQGAVLADGIAPRSKSLSREQHAILMGWALVGLSGAVNALSNFPMHLAHLALAIVMAVGICASLTGAAAKSAKARLAGGATLIAGRSVLVLLLAAVLGLSAWWLFLPYRAAQMRRSLKPVLERMTDLRQSGNWSQPHTIALAREITEKAERMVKMDPWTAENQFTLGLAYFFGYRFGKAEESYLKAVAIRATPTMYSNLGTACAEMGDPIKARLYYGLALRQYPFHEQTQEALKKLGETITGRKYPDPLVLRQIPLLTKQP